MPNTPLNFVKLPKLLNCLVLSTLLLLGAHYLATTAQAEEKLLVSSLVAFEFIPENFPAQLRAQATKLNSLAAKPSDDQSLQQNLNNLNSLVKTLSRGFQDEAYILLGANYERLNQSELAISAYEKSYKLRAQRAEAYFRHAYLLISQKKCEQALKMFNELLWKTDELHHEILYATTDCLMQTGNSKEALKLAEQANAKSPLYAPVLRRLVEARQELLKQEDDPMQRANHEQRMIFELIALTNIEPDDRNSSLLLANLLLKKIDPLVDTDRLSTARALSSRFVDSSKYKDDEAVRVLFNSYIKAKDLGAAETILAKGLEAKPESATLLSARKQLEIERTVATQNIN